MHVYFCLHAVQMRNRLGNNILPSGKYVYVYIFPTVCHCYQITLMLSIYFFLTSQNFMASHEFFISDTTVQRPFAAAAYEVMLLCGKVDLIDNR